MVLDYTITIGPCLLLKALSYSNFVHSHLVSFTMHFLAIQGTVRGRPARITSYSTGGNEKGVRLLLIKKTEVFMLADSGIEATYGMAVEVAAQWLSSSDIQSARICPHFSSSEVAQDTYSVSVLGAVHILRNTGWGGGVSS